MPPPVQAWAVASKSKFIELETSVLQRAARKAVRLPNRLAVRRMWFALHKWLGLSAGLLFVVLGLTGSVLVFDHAIDEWLNPQLLLTQGSDQRQPVHAVIVAAEQAFRGADKHAVSLTRPRVANGVWSVWFSSGTEQQPAHTAVYVDPYSLRVTGQRVWGHDLMSWIYRLHYTLVAGKTGGTVVGLLGVALLMAVISGIYLWWPLLLHGLRAAFAIRRGRRWAFDTHKVTGVVSAVLLSVLAFTGAVMEFPVLSRNLVSLVLPITPKHDELKSTITPRNNRATITADQAIKIAQRRFPNARWDHLHPPKNAEGVFEVALRQPNEVQRTFGRTQVFIDQYSGAILAQADPNHCTVADAFFASQFPLHSGEALGLVGRWLVFVTGLTPAVLYITGLTLWWNKRRGRKRQLQRRQATQSPRPLSERPACNRSFAMRMFYRAPKPTEPT